MILRYSDKHVCFEKYCRVWLFLSVQFTYLALGCWKGAGHETDLSAFLSILLVCHQTPLAFNKFPNNSNSNQNLQIQTLFISLCFSFSSVFKSKNPTVSVETPNLNYTLLYFSLSRPFGLPIWFLSIKLSLSVKTSEYVSLPASYKWSSQDSQTPLSLTFPFSLFCKHLLLQSLSKTHFIFHFQTHTYTRVL